MELNEADLTIIHTRVGKNYITAIHKPTGISVKASGDGYWPVKQQALEMLEEELRLHEEK